MTDERIKALIASWRQRASIHGAIYASGLLDCATELEVAVKFGQGSHARMCPLGFNCFPEPEYGAGLHEEQRQRGTPGCDCDQSGNPDPARHASDCNWRRGVCAWGDEPEKSQETVGQFRPPDNTFSKDPGVDN